MILDSVTGVKTTRSLLLVTVLVFIGMHLTTSQCCITSQKSKNLIYTLAGAWNYN